MIKVRKFAAAVEIVLKGLLRELNILLTGTDITKFDLFNKYNNIIGVFYVVLVERFLIWSWLCGVVCCCHHR
jgi:hypothetical protein